MPIDGLPRFTFYILEIFTLDDAGHDYLEDYKVYATKGEMEEKAKEVMEQAGYWETTKYEMVIKGGKVTQTEI